MYFLDEKKDKLIPNCPSCFATFTIGKGANCSDNCSAKRLENKHYAVAYQIINHCLPNKVKVICDRWTFPKNNEEWEWGWTRDGIGEINIHWYTLRSKKKFLHCCSHEAGHIADYENQFKNAEERKIIKDYLELKMWVDYYIFFEAFEETEKKKKLELELDTYTKQNQDLINRWEKWSNMSPIECHKRVEWYEEYLRIYKELIKPSSPWKEYDYWNFQPLSHKCFIESKNY
jgi:hypothetical protein